jgi:hypothetical protein
MMSRGTLRSAGYSGVAWGVLTLLAYLSYQLASSTSGGVVLFQVLAPLAVAGLAIMMFFLASALAHPMAKIACYVGMAIALVFLLLHFVRIGGNAVTIIVSALLGISMIAAGAIAAMQSGSAAWKGFAILLIVAGALKAIVIGEIAYPFIACAAGIVLFVAMNAAAKQVA